MDRRSLRFSAPGHHTDPSPTLSCSYRFSSVTVCGSPRILLGHSFVYIWGSWIVVHFGRIGNGNKTNVVQGTCGLRPSSLNPGVWGPVDPLHWERGTKRPQGHRVRTDHGSSTSGGPQRSRVLPRRDSSVTLRHINHYVRDVGFKNLILESCWRIHDSLEPV